MSSLLEIKDLDTLFTHTVPVVHAVRHVNLNVGHGQTLALVGESGSGKSVTAHSILALLPKGKVTHPNGKILFKGQDLLTMPLRQLEALRGDAISMIFQEPMTALNPLHTIEKQISECLDNKQFSTKKSKRNKVLQLLEQVKIQQPSTRLKSYPHQLSGGQRQRIMIAMAIANEPELLIADEPTTALDVTVQQEILELLKSLQQQNGMAILLISHDLPLVKRYADHVAVMKNGEIVENASCYDLFTQPQHAYSQELLQQFESIKTDFDADTATLMSTSNLQVNYPLTKTQLKHLIQAPIYSALSGINLNLKKGETLGIVGESGSGKTTLAKALLKLVHAEGEYLYQQDNVSNLKEKAFRPYRQSLQVVFQDPFASLNPRMTVLQIIAEGLDCLEQTLTESEKLARVIDLITTVGLNEDCLYRFAHEFSGGQRQRIAIARALIMKPDCLILDEPTSALDRNIQFQVLSLLQQLQQQYQLSYIFISHDLALVKNFCHRVLVLKDGEQVEYNSADTLFSAPKKPYTQRLINAAFSD